MNKRTMVGALATLAVAISAAAPGALRAQQESDTQARSSDAPMLKVTNNNWLDMHVYVTQPAGPLFSLGVVTTNSTMTYPLPRSVTEAGAGLRVVADPIGDTGVYVSPTILVSPGSDVVVDIENALSLSNVSVQPQMSPQ